jgi:hypothetical protein
MYQEFPKPDDVDGLSSTASSLLHVFKVNRA